MSISALEQQRIALDTFTDKIEDGTIRSHLLTYSDTEIGKRHPDLPVGVMFRDQGQFDLYAGQTRIFGDLYGNLFMGSTSFVSTARYVGIPNTSWFDVNVGNQVFNPVLKTKQILTIDPKLDLSSYFIMNPNTRVEPTTGEILNKTPISSIIKGEVLFTEYDLVDSPEHDHHQLYMDKIAK